VYAKHVLRSAGERLVKDFSVGLVVKSELNDTRSVAKVDKYKRAKVSLSLNPTHNANLLTDHLFGYFGAVACSFVLICQKFCHNLYPFIVINIKINTAQPLSYTRRQ
jgi:hypothetical protein